MMEYWDITIPELSGDTPRRAYCYVPDIWEEAPSLRFPVLYMFDGHNVFLDDHATYGKSWGMLEYLEETQIPLIVATVECNHGKNNERLNEYCPFNAEMPGWGRIRGQGRITMEWYTKQFKPYIDENYPTLPDREHTFIAGSSMGGLMSLYAITEYNSIFSRCAALSPSLWFGGEKTERMLTSHRLRRGTVAYMDYGEREMRHRSGMARAFGHYASLLMEKGALVTARIIPKGEHTEASWENQIPFFMETLFYDLELDLDMDADMELSE